MLIKWQTIILQNIYLKSSHLKSFNLHIDDILFWYKLTSYWRIEIEIKFFCDMSGNSQSLRTESDKKIILNTLFQKIGLSENGMLVLRKVNHCFAFYSRTFHSRLRSCRWRAAKLRLLLRDHGPCAGRDLYRAPLAMTRDTVSTVSLKGLSV